MKRSEINKAIQTATAAFKREGWHLPPAPRWDVTDFGLGRFGQEGLVLINLAEEPEYCEKLMYAAQDQLTPAHYHKVKKEDIICRAGRLSVQLWADEPSQSSNTFIEVNVDGQRVSLAHGGTVVLEAGSRITLKPFVWHAFSPKNGDCVIGEVSTANNDVGDNFFANPEIGRFSQIEEDEPTVVRLVHEL